MTTRFRFSFPRVSKRAALPLLVLAMTVCSGSALAQEGRQSDLKIFKSEYMDRSPVFTPEARTEANRLFSDLAAKADSMSDAQFYFALARIAALADNGHDGVIRGKKAWSPNMRLPFRMIWLEDGLMIARTAPEYSDLAGAMVETIDGHTPKEILEKLRVMQGGPSGYRKWSPSWVLHSPEALKALGLIHDENKVTLAVRLRNGKRLSKTIAPVALENLPAPTHPQTFWYPEPLPGESERRWTIAAPPSSVPLYLQEPDRWFRMSDLPDIKALYVQFRINSDHGDEKIAPFVSRVSERLNSNPPQNLILDLRFDTGGDNTQNRQLMKEIAEKVPGRIYVLTGDYTFSAGIASTAAIVHDGGAKVTVVGSTVGDRMQWWSEGQEINLPASDFWVRRNDGFWDIENGCAGTLHCFSDQFDLKVASLKPQIWAPVLSRDWLEGRDPAMDEIRKDLGTAK